MDTQIEFFVRGEHSHTTEALREYAVRRLSFAVRRFAHHVRQVTVRLVDENGPRRGRDSRCSMTADLVDGGQLFVEATAAWPFAAITQAAGRLREALRRDDPLVHHLLRHGMVFSAAVGLSHEQLSLAVVMRDEGDSFWLVHSGTRHTRRRGHNRSSSPHMMVA